MQLKCTVTGLDMAEKKPNTNHLQNITKTDLIKNYEAQKRLLKTVNVQLLPDKGLKILESIARLQKEIDNFDESAGNALLEKVSGRNLDVKSISQQNIQKQDGNEQTWRTTAKPVPPTRVAQHVEPHLQKNESDINSIVKKALTSYTRCFEACPGERDESQSPSQLSTELLPHQRQALTWMKWREIQVPSGGILGDDMGFGKTLSMIALILSQKTENGDSTLIVCLASLMHHWVKEFKNHCKGNPVHVEVYHGPKRHFEIDKFADGGKYVVVTTYDIVRREMDSDNKQAGENASQLLKCKWARVVLDEGHVIRNPRSKISNTVCSIAANHRWIITGTPIHNSEDDAYALIRFLKCDPFDDQKVWKHVMKNGKGTASERLNIILRPLLLRRTKGQSTITGKPLVQLPKKSVTTHCIDLVPSEKELYQTVLTKYKTQIKSYFSSKQNKTVRGTDVLVCLLRLRQLCCHPCLAKQEVPKEELELENLFANLTLDGRDTEQVDDFSVKQDVGNVMGNELYSSTKMTEFLEKLKTVHATRVNAKMKSIVVSQWTSMLDVVALHLKKCGFRYQMLTGKTTLKARQEIVEDLNGNPDGSEVLLLSLTAGGTGLNLIGASNLFILDLHWNPALEMQAHDRIHRVGQQNDVHIHRFVCKDTVEEAIDKLHKRKLDLAANALSPNRKSKSSLDQLKEIFGF